MRQNQSEGLHRRLGEKREFQEVFQGGVSCVRSRIERKIWIECRKTEDPPRS
ncbi:hypothetical protein HOLDEFILI_04101 [Holdemania filiformis DSM 12042]|uniref:Uncharacterized protein n=1 Tax=Holdemania filiformis DSM 12042 TaxID=545696 RepID=B9YE27_9FIRM|nr:hypothetical protein HOLDEFILI_04101 [Holdemania filiformis DSM 12042]